MTTFYKKLTMALITVSLMACGTEDKKPAAQMENPPLETTDETMRRGRKQGNRMNWLLIKNVTISRSLGNVQNRQSLKRSQRLRWMSRRILIMETTIRLPPVPVEIQEFVDETELDVSDELYGLYLEFGRLGYIRFMQLISSQWIVSFRR